MLSAFRSAAHAVPLLWIALLLPVAGPRAARAATLSGFVTSGADGEALDFANVFIEGTPYGDMANEKGFYLLTGLPAGTWTVTFSYMGYELTRREVSLGADEAATLSVELRPTALRLPTVEVEGEGADRYLTPGEVTLRAADLRRGPAVAEADLFRVVQALPGVSTLSDFSSGLYVRGGSPDQNLILLDDIDVYNPNHLFGFFSTFNVDAVKSVDLQKSGFPARYGGRLSSLLDVHNREGNRKEFQGVSRLSVIGSSVTLDGPWSHGSWMVAGRRTWLEAIAKAADIDLPYYFYDLHGRVNYDPGPGDKTSLSLFRSRDRLDWQQETIDVILDWGNDTWSSQWTHIFGQKVFSHFVAGGSRFRSTAKVAFQDFEFRMANRIDDLSLRGDLSVAPSANHLLGFGAEVKALDFSWKRDIGEGESLEFSYDGYYGAVYAEDQWKLSDRLEVEPGLRIDGYSKANRLGLGPRLTVRRKLNEMLAAHVTAGRYFQYLNLVAQDGASFADMWFPVDKTLDPGKADQYILGVEIGPYEDFSLSVEGYYKNYDNLVEFSQEFGRSLFEADTKMGDLFDSGTGQAFGTDLYLRTRLLGFEGWAGYAWGVARREIAGFNGGEAYSPVYDRRHQIVVMQDCSLGGNWSLNLAFRYGSGQPATLAVGRYTVTDITGRSHDEVLPGDYNSWRLPDYHRLDLGLSWRKKFRTWTLEPSLQLINVYNHPNVFIRSYDLTKSPVEFDDVTMIPFLPTLGVNITF